MDLSAMSSRHQSSEMTTASNIDVLTDDEAQLLTSLVSAGNEKTLLQKALVTIGNKAAFTSNQVIVACIH